MARATFSIRDLLWLMLVLGLIVGWYIDHRQSADKLTAVHLQMLMNFPAPEPKPELKLKMLEKENELLRGKLAELKGSQ